MEGDEVFCTRASLNPASAPQRSAKAFPSPECPKGIAYHGCSRFALLFTIAPVRIEHFHPTQRDSSRQSYRTLFYRRLNEKKSRMYGGNRPERFSREDAKTRRNLLSPFVSSRAFRPASFPVKIETVDLSQSTRNKTGLFFKLWRSIREKCSFLQRFALKGDPSFQEGSRGLSGGEERTAGHKAPGKI